MDTFIPKSIRHSPKNQIDGNELMISTLKDRRHKILSRSLDKSAIIDDSKFEDIVYQIYEEKFIDCLFEPFVNTISRENFVNAFDHKSIFDTKNDSKSVNWIFCPEKIRDIF